jgi:hypothetical protein
MADVADGDARRPVEHVRDTRLRRAAFGAGLAVLACQLCLVAYEHLGPTRYFAWAPNDYVVQYRLHASVDGHPLSAAQVRGRYHLPAHGLWYFPAQHIIDDVQQLERTYGAHDRVRVTLTYRLNGHPQQTWRWTHG